MFDDQTQSLETQSVQLKQNISATSAVLFQRKCKQLTQLTPITQLTLINATRLIICICVCKTLQVLP